MNVVRSNKPTQPARVPSLASITGRGIQCLSADTRPLFKHVLQSRGAVTAAGRVVFLFGFFPRIILLTSLHGSWCKFLEC